MGGDMGYSLQSSVNDEMSSALDFQQSFGGLDKSSKGIGTNELIVGGVALVLVVFLLMKKGK